jgi:transcriptional antiterminator RfaH
MKMISGNNQEGQSGLAEWDQPGGEFLQWYCVRSKPKHEHIAAAHLRSLEKVEVYCPRLRSRRMTRKGPAWFTEAFFPGYLFARFDSSFRRKAVLYAQGVSGIVQFGGDLAVVPQEIIEELKNSVSDLGVHVIDDPEIRGGDSVVVTRGIFKGIRTLVTQSMPSAQRVRILLEILGECREVVVSKSDLLKEGEPRALLGGAFQRA